MGESARYCCPVESDQTATPLSLSSTTMDTVSAMRRVMRSFVWTMTASMSPRLPASSSAVNSGRAVTAPLMPSGTK